MQFSPLGRFVAALSLGSVVLGPAPASAITITLDTAVGAVHDGVGDGWFFAGGPAIPPDGVGDTGGNAPAIVYQAGVVEMRVLSELPLAALAGYDASEITSATLTVTIDDVLSTFGPGTAFDGTAASPFVAYGYVGNGAITPADFSPASPISIGTVTPGAVTDASLAVSGPLAFDLDLTALVQAYVTAANSHLGVMFATLDSPTGTSIDNLAPPGVVGGALPFITIEITPEAPPTYSADELKCQAGIAKAASGLAAAEQKAFAKCLDTILKTVSEGELASNATEACAKVLDPSNPKSAVAKAKSKTGAAIVKACGTLSPADVDSPCDAGAATFADTAACVVEATEGDVESMVADRYAKACVLLEAVGLDGAYPGVCNL
jgi:hypothetical protein